MLLEATKHVTIRGTELGVTDAVECKRFTHSTRRLSLVLQTLGLAETAPSESGGY
jgi:hypothetical protein